MRRVLLGTAVVTAVLVGAVMAMGASGSQDEKGTRYTVVLDNAFGVTEGVDLKVAGVRAGKVVKLDVRPSDARALVEIRVTEPGFGALRSDVFCEVRPQSLIGEYFLDCLPGTNGRALPPGATIPVQRTATTIPADLVQNVMRRPYRERLSLILNELGATLAARGEDLNLTIRRALPALRETNRVLAILDRNRFVIQRLTRDADDTLVRLADNRRNVTRFVEEARDTAAVTADRRVALRRTFRRFPRFLRELRPTMALLGAAARDQTPALRNLRVSAPELTTLLQRLGPFAEAARPAVRSLGPVAKAGRTVADNAPPAIDELREFTGRTPELAQNLAIVLEDLDNPRRAVENDPDAARQRGVGGQARGYSGLEALLQYPFDQALAINVFDRRGYSLKVNAILNPDCGRYTNAESAREDPQRVRECRSWLGPNQPGVTKDDPSTDGSDDDSQSNLAVASQAAVAALSRTPPAPSPARPAPSALTRPPGRAPGGTTAGAGDPAEGLLDYLLG